MLQRLHLEFEPKILDALFDAFSGGASEISYQSFCSGVLGHKSSSAVLKSKSNPASRSPPEAERWENSSKAKRHAVLEEGSYSKLAEHGGRNSNILAHIQELVEAKSKNLASTFRQFDQARPNPFFRVSVCAPRTLNTTGQSRVTLSLQ